MSPSYRIKDILKRSQLITYCVRKTRSWSKMVLYKLSPTLLAKLRFIAIKGRWPNLNHPQSFDEKLLWLMLYWRHPLKTLCTDKYAMRNYVEKHGLGHILPQLVGVYENSNEIDFDTLPKRFVLKCTHGCGFNIICKNKRELDIEETNRKLDTWMKTNFSNAYGEIHYGTIKRRIICEQFLDDFTGNLPLDYKVYCFYGKAHCTMVCTGRASEELNLTYYHYDRKWKNRLPYDKTSLFSDKNFPKPENYEEMIAAAETLSKPFPFVRIDFYRINGKVIIGEMTFTPADCIDPNCTAVGQRALGELICLPEKRLK